MKLLRLQMQGFKSFKDKTTIFFDDGITGIVGPNGCGKSNIVDALFWVMGEQSAKHLRGKNMKDLIFAGSDKYSPGSFAEATLVLGNEEGKHIHIGNQVVKPSEIQLTRKLYRNGETEYRINGVPARLKDIQEVFMDTGAGAKSYSIIAQGEINRLVQAKPVERRSMIEDVAGITKFKKRKQESLRKIDQTQTNLNRLNDLQSEIHKNLKALERQAEKAERARSLKGKIQKFDLLVESHKEFNFLKDFSEGQDFIAKNQTLLSEFTMKKDQLELTLQDERIRKTELTEIVDEAQAIFNEASRKLAAAEERLTYLKKSQIEKEELLSSKTVEIEELKNDISLAEEKIKDLNLKKEEIETESNEEFDFKGLAEKVETLKQNLSEKEEEYREAQAEVASIKENAVSIEQEYFRTTSKLEEFSANLEDIASEMEVLEEQSSSFSGELARERDALKTASEKFESLDEKATKLKSSLEELSQKEKELDESYKILSREVLKIESRKQSLVEINKTLEGAKEGAIKFLEDNGNENYEFLGKLVESDEEYAKAVESLFSHLFNTLVSKNHDKESFTNWYESNSNTTLDFLVSSDEAITTSEETIERLGIQGCEGIKSISSVISIKDDSFKNSIENLFKGFLVVENLTPELALKINPSLQFNGLVSPDGKYIVKKTINGNLITFKTDEDLEQGLVQRNNEIKKLGEELVEKQDKLEKVETDYETVSAELKETKEAYELLRDELNEAHTDYVSKKSALESKEAGFKSAHGRIEILANRKAEISKSRLELLEKEESLKKSIESQKSTTDEKAEIITELEEAINELKSDYESEREILVSKEVQAKTFQTRIEGITQQIMDAEVQLQKNQDRLVSGAELQNRYQEEINELSSGVEELEQENISQVDDLKMKEGKLNSIKNELNTLLDGMQGRESEVKDLTSQINKIDKALVEREIKLNQIIEDEELTVRNTFEKYQIDLRATLAEHLELGSETLEKLNDISAIFYMETEDGQQPITKNGYHFERRYGQALRECKDKLRQYQRELNRLGEINWQAIEDYNHQKVRYDFLKEQEIELKKSLADLETAINHIDEKSRVRFKQAYTDVNEKFKKVFPIIFGGGNARLEITGSLDDPECGIDIIAQPPGKKMQNINLMSGGEKAMTAVSLIFSIFLVKPSPFCLLDEVDAPLDDANVGRFNELLREMSSESQFILITHNKKTMELNDTLYGVTMQEAGVSKAVSVQLH
jgi:chromosome segregation protein